MVAPAVALAPSPKTYSRDAVRPGTAAVGCFMVKVMALGLVGSGATETRPAAAGHPVIVWVNGAATVDGPRALAARVDPTDVQSSDCRAKATGGATAPAAASVTSPLKLSATVFMEKSLAV